MTLISSNVMMMVIMTWMMIVRNSKKTQDIIIISLTIRGISQQVVFTKMSSSMRNIVNFIVFLMDDSLFRIHFIWITVLNTTKII